MSDRPLPPPRPDPRAEFDAANRQALPLLARLFENPADEEARAQLAAMRPELEAAQARMVAALRPKKGRRP